MKQASLNQYIHRDLIKPLHVKPNFFHVVFPKIEELATFVSFHDVIILAPQIFHSSSSYFTFNEWTTFMCYLQRFSAITWVWSQRY